MPRLTRAEDSSKQKLKRPKKHWQQVSALRRQAMRSWGRLRGERLGVTCPYLTFPCHIYWYDDKTVHCSPCRALGEGVTVRPRAPGCLIGAFAPHQGGQAGAEPPQPWLQTPRAQSHPLHTTQQMSPGCRGCEFKACVYSRYFQTHVAGEHSVCLLPWGCLRNF